MFVEEKLTILENRTNNSRIRRNVSERFQNPKINDRILSILVFQKLNAKCNLVRIHRLLNTIQSIRNENYILCDIGFDSQ